MRITVSVLAILMGGELSPNASIRKVFTRPREPRRATNPHGHHDGGHDKWDGRHGLQDGLAGKLMPGEQVGRGQSNGQGEERRDCRLPCGEPNAAEVVRVAQQPPKGASPRASPSRPRARMVRSG